MRKATASSASSSDIPDGEGARIGIVVAEWNQEVTQALLDGAIEELMENGVLEKDIQIKRVPGSFEIPHAAERFLDEDEVDAVITLGSLIRGETIHFEVIAHSIAQALQEQNTNSSVPVLFGVLTDENMEQARARAGGEKGNKGKEAAIAALKMIALN